MSALAEYLRLRMAEDVRRMEPQTRLRLALELGDADLARYCAVTGADPADARLRLGRQRQAGRRPSASARR